METVARFFQNGSSLDLIKVEELLLFRYSNMDYIMRLEVDEGVLLINKALEEQTKQRHWEMWLAKYTLMDSENHLSFEDFSDAMLGKNISRMSKEEALNKAMEIEKKAQKKRGGK